MKQVFGILFSIVFFHSIYSVSQVCDSISGNTSLGIYGGLALDLTFSDKGRLFATSRVSASLFISDDTAQTWYNAFPNDSLEYECGERGWGGGGLKVLSNRKNWVLVNTNETGGDISAAVVNFNNGDTTKWKTLLDAYLMKKELNLIIRGIKNIALSDKYLYVLTNDSYIVKFDSSGTLSSSNVFDIASIPGIDSNFIPISIAVPNSSNGYPFYVIIDSVGSGGTKINGQLYKYDGIGFSSIGLPTNFRAKDIFTHPGQINGDTIFVVGFDSLDSNRYFRSYNGGVNWEDISNYYSEISDLQNADYSPYWTSILPQSNGLILSCKITGMTSFDLGTSWVEPSSLDSVNYVLPYTIAFGPQDTSLVAASSTQREYTSSNGITGNFVVSLSDGLEAILIWDIERNASKSMFYLATQSGLAYTTKYTDGNVSPIDKWQIPYGEFPIKGTDVLEGITSVALDKADSLHVIAAYKDGFFVTHTGNNGFATVNPTNFSGGAVWDIKFINSDIILAVTNSKTEQSGGSNFGEIWRSTDGGDNWSIVSPNGFAGGNTIALGYNNADTVIYIGSGLGSKEDGYLYKSADLGVTWSVINSGPHDQFYSSSTHLAINEIEIDPRGTDTLYIVAGLDSNCAFVKSYDGGLTYQYLDVDISIDEITYFSSIEIQDPDSLIYFSNGEKLFLYLPFLDTILNGYTGLPGDWIHDIALGSILVGTTTGFYTIEIESFDDIITSENSSFKNDFLKLYPNPAKNKVFVEKLTEGKYTEVELFTLLGKKVENIKILHYNNKIMEIDIHTLSEGIYIMRMSCANEVSSAKIIIE